MADLRPAQRRLLESLDTNGPEIIEMGPYTKPFIVKLWNDGLIERHGPRRFRITDAGRAALLRAEITKEAAAK